MRKWVTLTFTLVVTLTMLPTPSHAQAPETSTCSLEPVSLPLFNATPAATIAATPAQIATPAADLSTVNQGVAVIFACLNLGQPEYAWAVFTDHYIASWLVETNSYQPAFEQALNGTVQTQPDTFELVEISSPELQPDGRVKVKVTYTADGQSRTDTLLLTQENGVWLVDGVVTP